MKFVGINLFCTGLNPHLPGLAARF